MNCVKIYRIFTIDKRSEKLKEHPINTAKKPTIIGIVGVPCLLRSDKNFGSCPLSDMPIIW